MQGSCFGIFIGIFLIFSACGQFEEQEANHSKLNMKSNIYQGVIDENPDHITAGWLVTDEGYMCSGVLLDNQTMLTAGHCLEGPASKIYFEIKSSRDRFRMGKQYVIKGTRPSEDIGILKLKEPFKLDQSKFFPLAEEVLKKDELGTVIGYGENIEGQIDPNNNRYSGTMSFKGYDSGISGSGAAIFSPIQSGQMPCMGDSGGPVITGKEDNRRIAAIVQGAKGILGPPKCGQASKSLFVPIFENRAWIKNYLNRKK